MPLSKTLTANGSRGHHKFTLEVTESSTNGNSSFLSYTFKLAPIQSGWDWSGWGSSISYSISIGGNVYTGTIPSYNGSSTVTLKSGSNIKIPHEADGTKTITVSFAVTDSTGQSYTCGNANSSGSFTLSQLHKAPDLNNAEMEETNQAMINLGVPGTTIVQYLSKKKITLHATPHDGATLTYYIRHFGTNYRLPASGYQASNIFNADYTTHDIVFDASTNKINIMQWVLDSQGAETTDFIKVLINGTAQKPNVIPYAKPNIERASTSIKRKSGGGTTLTENKAVLNLVATFYKGSNIVGNNNSITQIGYKIWDPNGTEPATYTTLTPTVSGGNITVNNLELSNLLYTKTYKYKIILKDNYGYQDVMEGTLPTGQSIFTEYKDRVDFLKITVGGKEVVPNKGVGNYAKIRLTARYTTSQNAWQQTQINFTNSSFISSDDGNFTKATYGIICNFDGVVLITKALSSNATAEIDIAVDGGGGLEIINTGGYNTYHNYIKTVSSGDLIDITFNSNNASFTVYEGTQISIVRIK